MILVFTYSLVNKKQNFSGSYFIFPFPPLTQNFRILKFRILNSEQCASSLWGVTYCKGWQHSWQWRNIYKKWKNDWKKSTRSGTDKHETVLSDVNELKYSLALPGWVTAVVVSLKIIQWKWDTWSLTYFS